MVCTALLKQASSHSDGSWHSRGSSSQVCGPRCCKACSKRRSRAAIPGAAPRRSIGDPKMILTHPLLTLLMHSAGATYGTLLWIQRLERKHGESRLQVRAQSVLSHSIRQRRRPCAVQQAAWARAMFRHCMRSRHPYTERRYRGTPNVSPAEHAPASIRCTGMHVHAIQGPMLMTQGAQP